MVKRIQLDEDSLELGCEIAQPFLGTPLREQLVLERRNELARLRVRARELFLEPALDYVARRIDKFVVVVHGAFPALLDSQRQLTELVTEARVGQWRAFGRVANLAARQVDRAEQFVDFRRGSPFIPAEMLMKLRPSAVGPLVARRGVRGRTVRDLWAIRSRDRSLQVSRKLARSCVALAWILPKRPVEHAADLARQVRSEVGKRRSRCWLLGPFARVVVIDAEWDKACEQLERHAPERVDVCTPIDRLAPPG